MRYRTRLLGLVMALAAIAAPSAVSGQGTAADSAHWREQKADLDIIARDRSAPKYSRDAQARVRARDSLHQRPPATPVPPTPAVASVTIVAPSPTIATGGTMQLIAEPKSASGVTLATPVQWSSGPASVGVVSGTGKLAGVAAGTVTVTARADTVVSSRSFTVVAITPPDTTTPPDTVKPLPPPTGDSLTAELPRMVPVPPYPRCERTTTLTTVSSLQAALDASAFGDCIALPAGTTYVGNFTWPAKAGAGWVTLMTVTTSPLPPPGTRMTPSRAAGLQLARILSPNYDPAIQTAAGAHGLKLLGVEVSYTPAAIATTSNVLVRLQDYDGGSSLAAVPYDFAVDRSYLHGLPTLDMRRCLLANSRNTVVIDSWLDECHSNNSDSQAILGYNGTSGLLVKNSTLYGGHEPIMLGGADTPSAELNPSDVTLVGNHIGRPTSWYRVWQAKNCVETKNVLRMIVEGNVVENCPADAQAGYAFVLKTENQSGTAPWSTSRDITVRYNRVRNVSSGFNLSGKGTSGYPNIAAARITICHNIVEQFLPVGYGGEGIPVQVLSQMTDAQLCNNTFTNDGRSIVAMSMDGAPSPRLVMRANVMHHGEYGVKGSGTSDGVSTLNAYAPGYVFTTNAIVASASCTQYPATTTCPAAFPPASATLGADTALVNAKTAGAVIPDAVALGRARAATPPGQLKHKWRATSSAGWHDDPRPWLPASERAKRKPAPDIPLNPR